ncbi:flavin monoamine oxidase family protein [Streptomyces sp. MMS24-I2-30]|uniref:flavin monoamine oxidase family protein n=1 Tax=Streptomyces sp. MMS24-I2-30 TaxID=3351564 RepID=UPI0038968434
MYATNLTCSIEFGADIDQLAAYADDEGREMLGGDLLLPDGYNRLLDRLRCDIEVRTGTVVTAVRQDADGVGVTLRSGETARAGRVVLTVPIGVLKAASIGFDPPLPQTKKQAIDALGAALLDKPWLEFPKVFWDKDVHVIEFHDPRKPGRWSMWVNGYKVFGKPVLLGFNGDVRGALGQ